jgi:hypothetical protein
MGDDVGVREEPTLSSRTQLRVLHQVSAGSNRSLSGLQRGHEVRLSVGGWLVLCAIGFVIALVTLNFALMGSSVLVGGGVLAYGAAVGRGKAWRREHH